MCYFKQFYQIFYHSFTTFVRFNNHFNISNQFRNIFKLLIANFLIFWTISPSPPIIIFLRYNNLIQLGWFFFSTKLPIFFNILKYFTLLLPIHFLSSKTWFNLINFLKIKFEIHIHFTNFRDISETSYNIFEFIPRFFQISTPPITKKQIPVSFDNLSPKNPTISANQSVHFIYNNSYLNYLLSYRIDPPWTYRSVTNHLQDSSSHRWSNTCTTVHW